MTTTKKKSVDVSAVVSPATNLWTEVTQTARDRAVLTDLATVTRVLSEAAATLGNALDKQRLQLRTSYSEASAGTVGVELLAAKSWAFLIDGDAVPGEIDGKQAWQKLKTYGITGLSNPRPASRGDLVVFEEELEILGYRDGSTGPLHIGRYATILWQGDSRYIPNPRAGDRRAAIQCVQAAQPSVDAASGALYEAAALIRMDVLNALPEGSLDTQTQGNVLFLLHATLLRDHIGDLVGVAGTGDLNDVDLTYAMTKLTSETANVIVHFDRHVQAAYERARSSLPRPARRRLRRDKVNDCLSGAPAHLRDAVRKLHAAVGYLDEGKRS